jgi:tRNA(Ile)-lysidine synthetase-like protein
VWPLTVGTIRIPGWDVRVDVERGESGREAALMPQDESDAFQGFVDDEPGVALDVRFWQKGARMVPSGMAESKKLQDIFVDAKIPRTERHRIPLVYRGGECIWAVGIRRSAAVRSTPKTVRKSLKISFQQAG